MYVSVRVCVCVVVGGGGGGGGGGIHQHNNLIRTVRRCGSVLRMQCNKHSGCLLICAGTLQTTGQLGVVKGTPSSGGIVVMVKGRVWQYHPFCIKPSPDEKPPDSPGMFASL